MDQPYHNPILVPFRYNDTQGNRIFMITAVTRFVTRFVTRNRNRAGTLYGVQMTWFVTQMTLVASDVSVGAI